MINPDKPFNIAEYREIFLRRKYYFIIPFVLILTGTFIYTALAPRIYEASTLILITPQKVPSEFVRTTVTTVIAERLSSIEQEIKSRTRLEQIIKGFNMQGGKGDQGIDNLVNSMQKNIKVQIARRGRGEDSGYFTISYASSDPVVATKVTNKLADLFMEENLKLREQQARGTTDFLKDELTAAKAKLDEQEEKINAFKRRYMGELPEQRDVNMRRLEQLQILLQRTSESLRSAQDRKLVLQKQLADLSAPVSASAGPDGRGTAASGEPQLHELKRQLADLRTRYRDVHPDVVKLKKKIQDLETNRDYNMLDNPRYRELTSQMEVTDREIARLRVEEVRVRGEIDRYSVRIERTSEREQAMASIMSEYQNTKTFYESLLKKSQDAQQAENLEMRQKGEQFRVIDPAEVPANPVRPNIPKVLLLGFVAAIGTGLGAAFLREQLDRSFHDPEDVEATFGIKVMATIPRITAE